VRVHGDPNRHGDDGGANFVVNTVVFPGQRPWRALAQGERLKYFSTMFIVLVSQRQLARPHSVQSYRQRIPILPVKPQIAGGRLACCSAE
jgi:hypothetical protein